MFHPHKSKENQDDTMNMHQLKAKVLSHLASAISQHTPQQLANYSKQFVGTGENLENSIKSGTLPNSTHEGAVTAGEADNNSSAKPFIPKKVNSGFIPRKS